ncbi:MAG: RimK family alpha-L-glutamate ligase [Pirellulaceae bacterium]|nr:RimK family alpha-L-glutamate ligase [Pirellulaceae bacterium]
MRRAFGGDDLTSLAEQLASRITRDPDDAAAILDMSTILQIRGHAKLAAEMQWQALSMRQHYTLSSHPQSASKQSASMRLLAIMSPGDIMANTPVEFLVEDSDIALEYLYLGRGLPAPEQLPSHDLAFLAVCESQANQELLAHLSDVKPHWPTPWINSPSAIARLTRDGVPTLLWRIPNVMVSDTQRMAREEVEGLVHFAQYPSDLFPIIARPVDSHAGFGLQKLTDAVDITNYLRDHDDREFYVAPFIDYRSQDGKYRKFRIVVLDGQPMAAHMAVSERWMVHYLNADMLSNAEHRAEEAHFMTTFEDDFAVRHRPALTMIDQRLGLDYYSIDCAETRSGQLIVFEIDNGAVVHSMDPVDIFPYKLPQMQKVFAAFRRLLNKHRQPRRAVA